jgi:putative transposase
LASTSVGSRCGPEAILSKIGYTLANAVKAGLAHNPEDWPGVTHAATEIGTRKIRTDRPKVYFDPDNKRWPESAEITLTVPQELEAAFGGWEEARARIVETVKAAVLNARKVARKAGLLLKSLDAIYATKHTRRASSRETPGERNPTFAAAGTPEQAARALHDRRTFLGAYREAMQKVREGVLGVLFPQGTWRMHREFGFGISTP